MFCSLTGEFDFSYDESIMIKYYKKNVPASPPPSAVATPVSTTQFGASLQFIKENNNGDPIPPIVRQCVEFLDTPDGNIYFNFKSVSFN